MNAIEKLNILVNKWASTDIKDKNKMDEIQKQIVEIRNKITEYPIELINMSESIKTLKNSEQWMDNYATIEEYLKLFEKYHIKYDKEINLIKPDTEEIIKEIWRIKEKKYSKNPKYDAREIKSIIKELTLGDD